MAKYNRIILYCDYGLDDAIATAHILNNASMFEKIYIVPIGGNQPVDKSLMNAFTILGEYDGDTSKVTVVDTREISQNSAVLEEIHGADGIGGFLRPAIAALPPIGALRTNTAFVRLDNFPSSKKIVIPFINISDLDGELKSAPSDNDIVLSLGPLTVPRIIDYAPPRTVLMASCVTESPNYGDYEYNEALDPAAFKAFAPKAEGVATLDVCHEPPFSLKNYTRTNNRLIDRLIEREVIIYNNSFSNQDGFHYVAYDLVAALFVTNPEMFTVTRVTLSGGRTFNALGINDKKARLKI